MTSYVLKTQDAAAAARAVRQGRVAAFPTGTCYGLAVDARQGHALQRLRNLKQRPAEKTFTVFMKEALWQEFLSLAEREKQTLLKLNNQPLTVLVKPSPAWSHLSRDGLIGLRIIDHPLMRSLAEIVGVPLTATSANPAGLPPAFTPDQIIEYFPGKLDETTYDLSLAAILDAGTLPASKPSTVIRFTGVNCDFKIIRAGQLQADKIKKCLTPLKSI